MTNQNIEVAPIGVRSHVPMAAIEQVVHEIAAQFHPQKVILFGSHAYGQPHTESDVDILIIMETELPGAQQAVRILHATHANFGLDLIVYTPQRLAQRLEWGDSFLQEVITRGKVLYESAYD
jgi:uncharacterized protein